MKASVSLDAGANDSIEVLWRDADRMFCKLRRADQEAYGHAFLAVLPDAEYPALESIKRLTHEYELKSQLEGGWALKPLDLVRDRERTMLMVDYKAGVPLERLIGEPMEIGTFLQLASALSAAVGKLHACGLIHKDIKPSHAFVDVATGQVWLTGFGIASRLPRERQAIEPPEFIAGTLAYMAPEQTGRVNRSIDSRSDLYALGVTFYEMLTGSLPFMASDPMEWVHCHIARQPAVPTSIRKDIPAPISAITMKLLAKTAEERYQTAAGVESDLRRCLSEWRSRGSIEDFSPGTRDTPNRLMIPERLYGRDREIETLLNAFDRTVAGGRPELVLVAGYSGIGKSAVVNELHKPLVPPRGLFASGKYDQYKRDIPYATLAQAFQSLIRPLLSKNEEELSKWRDALREALDTNGLLIVELVPELKHIIGEQPPVPDLPPQDAKVRFQRVFRRFIGVFARPEHPLALFLDDLQWLDAATLDLLGHLLTEPDVQNLMLIGAYRNNEVSPTHPLMQRLDYVRENGAAVHEIVLAPLTRQDLTQLVADSFHCELWEAAPLSELVHGKTEGNPFFAIQFVTALVEEALISFDHTSGRWEWNLDRIRAKGYTDNVVELMVGKLSRLPAVTRELLQQLACLGNAADVSTLALVRGTSSQEIHASLWDALRQELVIRGEDSYRFVHDRVQEAAYSLIDESLRAEAHLRLGRRLATHVPREEREEAIFEIVNQYNRGAALVAARDERERLAELNLSAGRRAKASTAYASGLKYFTFGASLLTEEAWERRHDLIFPLELHRAECEFLVGDLATAAERLACLADRAADTVELSAVTCLRVDVHTTLDRSDLAIAVCLDYLRHLGIEWSPHPTFEAAHQEYERIWMQLGTREIEQLIDMPTMTDRSSLATLDVLTKAMPPALFTDENLSALVICGAVNLSLEHGNSDGSCGAYVWFGVVAGPRFGDYKAGFEFGELGYKLVEQRGLKRFQAPVYMLFGNLVMPWTKHIRSGQELVRRAFDAACKLGDLTFAGYSCNNLITNLLAAGDSLPDVQREAEIGLEFAQRARFGLIVDIILAQLGLIRTLRGLKPAFGSFNDEHFNETEFESHLASHPALAIAECWYWVRKLQARFFAADYASAIVALGNAERLLWTSPSLFEGAEAHFFGALCHAALCDTSSCVPTGEHYEHLLLHHRLIQTWAQNCPDNFENRAALVGAEVARIEGRLLDAEQLYEEAIRSAHHYGFVQNEAMANELAGRFYATRGLEKVATTYLKEARYCYLRWGADGKVRQLEQLHPSLDADQPASDATTTIFKPVEQLDLATVTKVSAALSGEIVLEKLVDTLMRTAIENAGAERGLLILPHGSDHRIELEAIISHGQVKVDLRHAAIDPTELPESIFRYVARTKESVLLHDASGRGEFSTDEYVQARRSRSVLCLPILKQTRLLGVLYLENSLTPNAFTSSRMSFLKLLASEAAISMENARLYRDLAEREARIRCLVEANIIGIIIWDLSGQILEANDAFLCMLGYDREDLASMRLRWTDLTPPEWRDRDEQKLLPELRSTGSLQPFEKEFFRKDGSRVPVLIGAAAFEEGGSQGVAFVLDLTERKRSADELRAFQMELAHANRLSTMGQIAASIAHEINQPIGAARNNAHAALRFLSKDPPDLGEIREAVECVVNDTYRASDIIGGIRDQVKKVPPRMQRVDLNDAILEVIALIRTELSKHRISVQTRLTGNLPAARADRVQLQQIILNLILNANEAMVTTDDESRELSISTSWAEAGTLLVAIADSGPGIATENRTRIFDSFYTTKQGGVGIGLSICRFIIDAHGGQLWAEAHEPRGAMLKFTLPVHS